MESPVRSHYAHVALYGPTFQRHDKTAREVTLLDECVHRPAFADVQGKQFRTPRTTQVEKMQQQIDWVRQDVQQLEI